MRDAEAAGADEVRRLIADLESLEHVERATAGLVACGAPAIPALVEFLLQGRPSGVFEPRRAAVEALAALGAEEVLKEYLAHPREIADPVARFGEEAVESAAARALGAAGNERNYPFLLELARTRMRIGLIDALAVFGRADALPFFDRALEDDFYRPAAEQAFRRIGAPARRHLALSALTPLPSAAAESPSSLRRRRSAIGLLVELGLAAEDLGPLADLLEEPDVELAAGAARLLAGSPEPQVRSRAAARIVEILPRAGWHLQDPLEEALVAIGAESRPLVEEGIARRMRLPDAEKVVDSALRTLLRVRRRLEA